MNEEQQKTMVAWLNDAHTLEMSLIENLEQKVKDAEEAGKIEVASKLNEHLEETRGHMEMVMAAIERLGGSVSKSKEMMGKIMGYFQGSMKSMFADVMVKNALESYAAEHVEIAAYTSLKAAAEELGDLDTADMCARILEDEYKTAEWALELIPEATAEHIKELSLS